MGRGSHFVMEKEGVSAHFCDLKVANRQALIVPRHNLGGCTTQQNQRGLDITLPSSTQPGITN